MQRSSAAFQCSSKVSLDQICHFSYILGVLVFLAAKSGFIKCADEAANFQNFILCVEMLVAAVGHLYAFPYKEYAAANISASDRFTGSLSHALKFNDFYHDIVHQFAPTYHDYVLYNTRDGDEGGRKYRSRTFVPTGQEMDTVRRNKHMIGAKLDDAQPSSVSSSGSSAQIAGSRQEQMDAEAMRASLLKETFASSAQPYDVSLIDMDLSSYPAKVPAVDNSGKR